MRRLNKRSRFGALTRTRTVFPSNHAREDSVLRKVVLQLERTHASSMKTQRSLSGSFGQSEAFFRVHLHVRRDVSDVAYQEYFCAGSEKLIQSRANRPT